MSEIFSIGVISVLWIVNLFNGTGLDQVYHVTDILKYVVIALSIVTLLLNLGNREKRNVRTSDIAVFGGMLVIFIATAAIHGHLDTTVDYIWVFLLTFLVAELKITSTVYFWICLIYGALGTGILIIYNFGSFFSGWNPNSIAMLGMHSYLMLLILFMRKSKKEYNIKNIIIVSLSAAIVAYLLRATNCRSGTLFLILAVLLYINLIPQKLFIGSKKRIVFVLLLPLIIAVVVAMISDTGFSASLNEWSLEKFEKPIFNGRDEIWINGFNILKDNVFIGIGHIMRFNWHNSAVTCLVTYGCLGYIFWIKSFQTILENARYYFKDYLVLGTVISFIVLYVQQSVELGFITSKPSFIPYIMLGMMLGRVNYLKKYHNSNNRYGIERK